MADEKKRDDFAIDMGERNGNHFQRPISPPRHSTSSGGSITNNPIFPVLSYCASSILMTVTNKFVLSGYGFNLNFFLLCVQVGCSLFLAEENSSLTGRYSRLYV